MDKLEKDIRLKTKMMGFDKKAVMDFIEQIQLENESLKREIQELTSKQNALLKENSMLRTKIDVFTKGLEEAARRTSSSSPISDVKKMVDEYENPQVGEQKPTALDVPVNEPILNEATETAKKAVVTVKKPTTVKIKIK